MQEITRKVKANVLAVMRPVIEEMAKAGMSHDQIVNTMQRHIDSKIAQYYQRLPERASDIIKNIDFHNPDSKAEAVFYQMLDYAGVPFKFHHKIGVYEADYLFNDHLVLELDGPKHNEVHDKRRDKYLKRMGYKVMRVPLWVMAMNPGAIVEEIKEQMRVC